MKCYTFIITLLSLVLSAHAQNETDCIKIALISDPHISDVIEHPELLRSMHDQTLSTRLFNENIMAFKTAIEDAHERGCSMVIIPGDMTDDGQRVNQQAARDIMNRYAREYNMRFLVTTGNHDPRRPYETPRGETGLMGTGSYEEHAETYASFGYSPAEGDIFWTTPFASYSYDDYSFSAAQESAHTKNRQYMMGEGISVTDLTYLVEPVPGLWIMAIDGNVYIPEQTADDVTVFQGAGKGYDHILKYKSFLIPWIKHISEESVRRGKFLLPFCHYPLADFNCGASDIIAKEWGTGSFDLSRVPSQSTIDAFIEAGLHLHVAGHMHVNNIAHVTSAKGKLTNIQTPSTAACIPAYHIITITNADDYSLETVTVSDVCGFNSFFDVYQKEWQDGMKAGTAPSWNHDILKSNSYTDFCHTYFDDLVRLRFVPQDLPVTIRDYVIGMNGRQILNVMRGEDETQIAASEPLTEWTGLTLVTDLYRIRYAGPLALQQIPQRRIDEYKTLIEAAQRYESTKMIMSAKEKDMAKAILCISHLMGKFLYH